MPPSPLQQYTQLRPIQPEDQAQLWDWLHVALWDPPPAGPRPRHVLRHPEIRIYAEAWGRPGDLGQVLVVNGRASGACWARLLPLGVGLASVDARTPQLGIGLDPSARGCGHGRRLLRAVLNLAREANMPAVALTVHPQNPAIALYADCGFVDRGERRGYRLMVASLSEHR
ncbi:MAG: GNAT family N-acetyltransferase [Abyssibacter sp.]|uniref:GNAT family N-acetyltransferase n=1 Tax=Abyssibacter sp. TaxID=2320200 RepID=UPI00321C3882